MQVYAAWPLYIAGYLSGRAFHDIIVLPAA
jgi:hypothetical protein